MRLQSNSYKRLNEWKDTENVDKKFCKNSYFIFDLRSVIFDEKKTVDVLDICKLILKSSVFY